MLRSKDYGEMLRLLAPQVEGLIAVPVPRSTSGLSPAALVAASPDAGGKAEAVDGMEAALKRAGERRPGMPVLVAGSLYLAGAALRVEQGGA